MYNIGLRYWRPVDRPHGRLAAIHSRIAASTIVTLGLPNDFDNHFSDHRQVGLAANRLLQTHIGAAYAIVGEKFAAASGPCHPPVFQNVGAAREFERQRHILLHEQAGDFFGIELANSIKDVAYNDRRQAQRWFVEHDELRRANQTASDRKHLLLAARERSGRLARAFGKLREHR